MIKIYNYGEVPNSEIFARENISANVENIVADIIADVRKNGDKALFAYSKKFDKAELASLEVTKEEIDEALSLVDPEFISVMAEAAQNIRLPRKAGENKLCDQRQGRRCYRSEGYAY